MVVTPFGVMELGDDIALARWVDAHARRHTTYTQILKASGGNMRGDINGDWFYRHWSRHVALATTTGIDLSMFTQGLALPEFWKTERELHDWHELHNRIHLKIDQQLGL